ncbi:MAG: isochorismate synthase MenF [Anaerolineae bacterium]
MDPDIELQSETESAQVLLSVTIPADGLDIYRFLRHGRGESRFLWRDQSLSLAGIGKARELFGWGKRRFSEIQSQSEDLFDTAVIHQADGGSPLASPHLFGGFSFTADFIPDVAWSSFYPAHFILPHYQFASSDGKTWLTINILTADQDEANELAADMVDVLHSRLTELMQVDDSDDIAQPVPQESSYPMSQTQWKTMLDLAIKKMRAGEMDKVVLSRVCEIGLDGPVSMTHLLKWLDEHYGECNRFLFEPQPFYAFYGATPETLIETNGRKIATMGLAGSAPRGDTPSTDDAFGAGLLNDPKNQIEHKLVVDSIRRRLEPLTTQLNVSDEPKLMKLGNIQHLYTPMAGETATADGIICLIEQLHPTPALGGAPRDKAMSFIASDEPVTRGWYGAPVGYLNQNLDGKFGVAIRSAVAQRDRVWAYAGAGIVADSDPDSEWEETAIKFKPMLNALRASS